MREPIELGYLSLPVKEVARARAFYGALFGWEFEGEGEAAHIRNTKLPLGLTTGGPADLSFLYFRVTDMAYATRRVIELGGAVREEKEYPSGLSAVCADDQDTLFSLWQPAAGY